MPRQSVLQINPSRSDTVSWTSRPESWRTGSLFLYIDLTGRKSFGFVCDGKLFPCSEIPGADQMMNIDLGRIYDAHRVPYVHIDQIGPLEQRRVLTTRYFTGGRRRRRRGRLGGARFSAVARFFSVYLTSTAITKRIGVFVPSFDAPVDSADDTTEFVRQLPDLPVAEIDALMTEFGLSRGRFEAVLTDATIDTPFSFPKTERLIGRGAQPSKLGEWYIESVSVLGHSWTDPLSKVEYTATINARCDPEDEVYGPPDEMLELLAKERQLAIRRIIDELDLRFRHRSWTEDRYHRTVWEAIIEHELKRRLRRFHSSTGGTVEGE